MGQIGFARRISASLQALFAHGEKRWLDEVDEARKGTLTLSTMVRHAYEAMDETAGVLRDLFDWGGSPVLPNVFIQAPAVDLPLGQSEFAWLPEPVLFDPKHPNDTFIDVTKPVLLGGAPKDVLDAVVELQAPGREQIKVTVTASKPAAGTYVGLVYRTDVKREIASVTVRVT